MSPRKSRESILHLVENRDEEINLQLLHVWSVFYLLLQSIAKEYNIGILQHALFSQDLIDQSKFYSFFSKSNKQILSLLQLVSV